MTQIRKKVRNKIKHIVKYFFAFGILGIVLVKETSAIEIENLESGGKSVLESFVNTNPNITIGFELIFFLAVFGILNLWSIKKLVSNREMQLQKFEINMLSQHKFLRIVEFLYSSKTQKEIFEPIVADWQEEYFEALFKKEIWKARWINVRYTYAFLAAMWMKSPIGSLVEFVIKIAKP